MTQQKHEDVWLGSIMPSGWSSAHSNHSCEPLELHKRLVHLATLREAALQRLGQLDAVKVALTERKATQQGRLLAALDARLSAAHAAVEPHRCAAWDLVKALEKEAAFYSDVLKGLQQSPPAEQWPSLTERYQQLQQQAAQQQEQAIAPKELEQALAAGLEPCQVAHVQVVEQLRAHVDSLTQQLQHAQHHAQQHQQQYQLAHHAAQDNASLQLQQQQDQQQAHCLQDLLAMQQLAALVLQQLQLYHSMQAAQQQQAHAHAGKCLAAAAGDVQRLQQDAQVPACSHTAGASAMQPSHPHDSGSRRSLLQVECQRLRQQLQRVSEAADVLVQQASAQGNAHLHSQRACATTAAAAGGAADCGLDGLSLELRDPLDSEDSSTSSTDSLGVSEAIQQLRQEMQAGLGVRSNSSHHCHRHHQQQQFGGVDVGLHSAMHTQHCSHSSSSQQDRQQVQLQIVKLRLAYQQMLHKVQARYQQDLRQVEVKHQEALQAKAQDQQQALAVMVKQHQEVCGRLAAAATVEAELKQEMQRMQSDKLELQRQVDKLQRDVSGAAASALAVAQVQHEQQLIAAKEEQQQVLHEAKQQVEQLQQQLQELQQQALQQPSVPSAETVAALVAEASAQHSAQQQEQLLILEANYQAALQQRERQHVSLLRELEDLRQLQEESSMISNSSVATDVTAAIPSTPPAAATAAATVLAAPAAPASVKAAGRSCADGVPASQQNIAGVTHQRESQYQEQEQAQQQQQQQHEMELKDQDAMSALIAAVLGPGPIGHAQQQLHQQRLLEQQKQQQEEEHKRQQQACAQQQREEQQELADMQAQLDKLLGLGSTHSQAAAALRNQQQSGVRPLTGTDYGSADLAPANADMAAALARAKVAETCLPPLQDISCSSAYNSHSPRGGDACSSSGNAFSSKPPWRPASPTKGSPQKQQQQQWQQWQQHPSAGGTKGRSRSPSPVQQQQQQQQKGPELPLLQCVRCGQQEGPDLGPCCFHPGLVAAPGPLMFGQEWHACRARCTPDMPGCYIRKDHFFSPLLGGGSSKAHSVASSTGATQGSQQQQAAATAAARPVAAKAAGAVAAAVDRGGLSPRLKAAGAHRAPQQLNSSSMSRSAVSPIRGRLKTNVSPPRPTVSSGRYVGSNPAGMPGFSSSSRGSSPRKAGALSPCREPEPRNNLPKPSVWRG